MVPSVTMKGAIRPLVTSNPFARPQARPARTAHAIAAATAVPCARPASETALSARTASEPTKAAIDPTERSIPPETMTKVIPSEMIPVYETCLRMLSRFCHCRKKGLSSADTMERMASAAKAA